MDRSHPTGYICVAVYRPRKDLLRTQLESVQAQTLTDWRCIVGIDGADAGARAMVHEIVKGDLRFEVTEFPDNVGFYRNFERILELVPSDAAWVALADQDDEWFPEKLERLAPRLQTSSLVFGQAIVTTGGHEGATETTHRRAVSLGAEMIDNQVTGSACMFRCDLLGVALPFPEPTDLAFHDHWLGVCASAAEGIAAETDALQFYVQHDANVIGEERASSPAQRLRAMVTKARGRSSGALRYLSDHRWGWRVSMARQLLQTDVQLRDADRAVLRRFAAGRISPGLVRVMATAVIAKDAPTMRAVGLMLGSLRRPRLGPPRHRRS